MNSAYFYPEDIEQRNIIERMASFVVKNGIDFELMTKQKQQGNPMFEFLFGGAYSDYYQYRLSEERLLPENECHMRQNVSDYLENKSTTSFPSSSNQYEHGFDFTQTDYFQNCNLINDMNKRLDDLRLSLATLQSDHYNKLSESQQNLTTESVLINKDKVTKCLNTVDFYRLKKFKEKCTNLNINFETMENHIEALIASCTKENICNGKNFVIENMRKNDESSKFICEYLLSRVSKSNIFNERLHVIYFLNDLLHYCKRKIVPTLLQAIESVLVLIYSMCVLMADESGKNKLNKVLSLWESNNYVSGEILYSMRISNDNPVIYLNDWQENEINSMKREEDEGISNDETIPIDETITRIFSDAKMKLSNLEVNHNQLKYELKIEEENIQLEIYQLERDIKMSESEIRKGSRQQIHQEYQNYSENDYSIPLVPNYEMSFQMPDFTRPPPGFTPCEIPCPNIERQFLTPLVQQPEFETNHRPERPSIPYWRLPAAVMVAHVKLAQYDYAPIDANAIHLPQLRPPSKRLLDITNTFYQPPSHDRPRDTEGWEKLALHEFYKTKEKAKNGEVPDDFINSLHERQNGNDFNETNVLINDKLMDTDYRNMDPNNINDYRQSFSENSCINPDYNFHHAGSNHFANSSNCNPRMNQRSLLGSPWEEYRHPPFHSTPEMAPARSINYNSSNRLGSNMLGLPRHIPQKVTPLMSLDIANNFKRHQNSCSKRDSYARNTDDISYDRNRTRRYVSRSRSPYNRSVSRSRSHSRSSRYSRSRSRTYSRSRSHSRSRSRSSQSSRSSEKRPYKGGFIARKSRSRSYSRSRSLSRSPRSKLDYDTYYNQPNVDRPENYESPRESALRNDHYLGVGPHNKEDVFSRFRQRKSVGYSEWMKERTEKRIAIQEDLPDNY